jgi:hypothetical protein
MSEAPNTIVGLAAQMRQLADLEENPKGRYANALRHYADIFVETAIRAVTRAAADAVNLTDEKWRRQCGDMAKMREALERISKQEELFHRLLKNDQYARAEDAIEFLYEASEAAKAALEAPPRNCDVGTPEEQAHRFFAFCRAHRTFDTACSDDCPFKNAPDINHCQSGWGQLPYDATKEGGDK